MSVRSALVVLALAVSSACGGGEGSSNTGSIPTGPSGGSGDPFAQTIPGTVSIFGTNRHPASAPRAGQMRVSLTWTAGVDLDLYLAPSSCQKLYPQTACGILAKSDASAGTSEVVSRAVTAGESFAIFVD